MRERAYMKIIDGIYSEIGTTKSVLNVREHIKKALFPFAMYQVCGSSNCGTIGYLSCEKITST